MIIVTGGAGFIGSNIVCGLNKRERSDVIVVDDLNDGHKFRNIAGCELMDYLDKDDFRKKIKAGDSFSDNIDAVFHMGACSTTTEWDGKFMMDNNYTYSKELFHYCIDRKIPFLYASSAAVYGNGSIFKESPEYEDPLNVYAYSKALFDSYVLRKFPQLQRGAMDTQVVGFRFFNVYGPREQHKGGMASIAYHHNNQMLDVGFVKLFEGCDGYGNGEQRRDFVYVEDVVDVNLWFSDHPEKSGIFNVGTGRSQTFNDVANAVIAWHNKGDIQYVPFPEKLVGSYQSYTQADISRLQAAGYETPFKTVEEGTKLYLDWLNQ